MSETQTFERHPKTGFPVQPVEAFKVGDLVTERFLGDGEPGVVVHATAKTVYVASVDFVLGNVSENDVPGYNGYGDSATLTVDPESVERALAKGKDGGRKYVLRVASKPSRPDSINGRETYGEQYHRAAWCLPNSTAGSLGKGASYRRDPHV